MTEQEITEAGYAVLNALTAVKAMKVVAGKDVGKQIKQQFSKELETRMPGLSDHVELAIHGQNMAPLATTVTGASIMRLME